MASSKEIQQSSRPLTQHRLSLSTTSSSGLTARQNHARTHSHSVLVGSLNPNHRVTRRKSMTNPAANVAAVAAALKEANDMTAAVPIATGARRNTVSKSAAARAAIVGSLPSPPASLPSHKFHMDVKTEIHESAIEDDANDGSADEASNDFAKARVRRASDGQPLAKEGRKSNRVELRCEKCGKGYKHSSCLTKHLWEHTPEWSFTSKLLISKHQQVQLLEAASVLVAMNNDAKDSATPPDSAKDFPSEPESASPAASGYSDERHSSADTTPPPQLEPVGLAVPDRPFSKRHSSAGGHFGRSYQSAPSTNPLVSGSVPSGTAFSHFRQHSHDRRPPSSGLNNTGQEDRDLAAAVELLSCSFNSNNGSKTVTLPADAPPVPPLPAQYLDAAASLSSTGFLNSFPSRQPESFTRGEMRGEDIRMEDSGESVMEDDEEDLRFRSRSDEDDDGVFGRMEE